MTYDDFTRRLEDETFAASRPPMYLQSSSKLTNPIEHDVRTNSSISTASIVKLVYCDI